MLTWPRPIVDGYEIRNSVSDADPGYVVRTFTGRFALLRASVWWFLHA